MRPHTLGLPAIPPTKRQIGNGSEPAGHQVEGRTRSRSIPLTEYFLYGIVQWRGKSSTRTEFGAWWETLDGDEQESVDAYVRLLEVRGPQLPFPYSSGIASSRHGGMRELRIQHQGRPYRVLYAFDPRRTAILLIGGEKTGDDRWYDSVVSRADALFDEHLETLRREGLI